jgi:D-3-phosphoglycerate dehydrogenase / 2-oxoglutarate reductase
MAGNVLVTDHPFHDFAPERAVLEPLGLDLLVAQTGEEEQLVELARRSAAILVCYARVGDAVIGAAAEGGCKVISRYGIGCDNVDMGAATRAGICVTNVPDYCLDEVADHTIALLLASERAIVRDDMEVRAGGWPLPDREVHRLAGRVLALVGLGAIGRRVAARARAFGLSVVVYDPYAERSSIDGVRWAESLHEALADADVVSLHAPLTDETAHLIDASALAALKRSPLLINTSRGGLVDLDAVVRALEVGQLKGVALDVTEPEPLPAEHPLRDHPRAIITPHTAFHSVESLVELQRRAAEEVARVLSGEQPESLRNPEVLTRTAASP